MRIHLYSPCYNEARLIPYFLRHYEPLCERIFVLDGESTDGSREILQRSPKVSIISTQNDLGEDPTWYEERILMKFRNGFYKRSRGKADWILIADIDEILWHPDLAGLLKCYLEEGVTLPKIQGFDMVADGPPQGVGQIYDEIKSGYPEPSYAKRSVFRPELDIDYEYGCHTCRPKGEVVESAEAEIKLLHYRWLGEDFVVQKYGTRFSRTGEESRRRGWGYVSIPENTTLRDYVRQNWKHYVHGRIRRVVP